MTCEVCGAGGRCLRWLGKLRCPACFSKIPDPDTREGKEFAISEMKDAEEKAGEEIYLR